MHFSSEEIHIIGLPGSLHGAQKRNETKRNETFSGLQRCFLPASCPLFHPTVELPQGLFGKLELAPLSYLSPMAEVRRLEP